MVYEPLHHKYRPQTFVQLTGQEAIAQTLCNALKSEKIAPAYLFCGPRGTGKTSSARILAKSLNCLNSDRPTDNPCGECDACLSITNGSALDVIEIDAASNTGVDNIREIIERAQFAPVKFRYKVYVIDECHMLSTAAFNALLKTLEEPPPKIVFVLATTDPQRVLPTIISRCQRFDYRRIPLSAMVKHLGFIAQQEQIEIDNQALSLVAQLSNGGMRDAQSLLDQLSLLSGMITPAKVWDLVGAVSEQDLFELLEAIATDSPEKVITQCRTLLDRGREPLIVLQNLANFYLNLLIAKTSPQRKDLVAVTETTWDKLVKIAPHWELNVILQGQKKLKDSEVQIRNTTQPRLWLEITFLSLLPSANQTVVVTKSPPNSSSQTPVASTKVNPPPTVVNSTPTKEKTRSAKTETQSSSQSQSQSNLNQQVNTVTSPSTSEPSTSEPSTNEIPPNFPQENLEELKEKVAQNCPKMTTRTFFSQNSRILRFDGKTAVIIVRNEALLEIISRAKEELESAFLHVTRQQVTILFQVNSNLNPADISPTKPDPDKSHNNTTTKIEQPTNPTDNSPAVPLKQNQVNVSNKSPIKESITAKSVDSTPAHAPQPSIPTSETTITDTNFSSNKQAKSAAESLAKSLNGEVILTESKAPPVQIKKIINRPQIEEISDDDDIPF